MQNPLTKIADFAEMVLVALRMLSDLRPGHEFLIVTAKKQPDGKYLKRFSALTVNDGEFDKFVAEIEKKSKCIGEDESLS